MAEFVEERLHVAVLHQPGRMIARGHVHHQRGHRHATPGDAIAQRYRIGVVVLARARVRIEIEAADQLAVIKHLERLDLRIPQRGLPGADLDAEQVLRQLEDAVAHVVVGEILARLLPVIGIVALLHLLAQIGVIPEREGLRAGMLALIERQLARIVALARGPGGGVHIGEQRLDLGRGVEHLVLDRERRIVLAAQQRRQFLPRVEHPGQHRVVRRISAGAISAGQPLAQRGALGVVDHWEVVGIVGRDRHLAVGAGFVMGDEIGGQAFQLGRIGAHRLASFGNRLIELGAKLGDLILQRLCPGALGVG